ncbi:ADP-ribosylarginine hydrolase [Latimeria chalumnae]|uniref:ADP-ribosylarginine hydrolase n=1 Tax=Latimeria chalumnae TaxID=7897 RepID=H3A2M6_LATCH|nr:PREDICTED: protein ADP-ribosylarginine hydrolase-like [Latimeria chalumnae]|eukprot:XP_006010000.1 PREDICTED: protein ADP-ribosylarginine hydrolase-like [Latimeria chalumnae]
MKPSQDVYRAAMLLSAAGDALGYRNERWEYCQSGPQIHKELVKLGGLQAIQAKLPDWPISDDTVLHLATGEALATGKEKEALFQELAVRYVEGMKDMEGRKPGPTSILGTSQMKPGEPNGYRIPFNPKATGCGAAMRSMCIGLRYPSPQQLGDLICVSVESGRMTHNHPTGFLGALASALFTAYSVQRKPLVEWGAGLLATLPQVLDYVKSVGVDVQENIAAWSYFTEKWTWYLTERGILEGKGVPQFPSPYGPEQRDEVYKTFSLDGWAGRSGHDAPMIAYDALLAAGASWEELCSRSMFHGGDSDSTGVIAGCCWGILHGLSGVPEGNYSQLEYRSRMEAVARRLFELAWEKTQ